MAKCNQLTSLPFRGLKLQSFLTIFTICQVIFRVCCGKIIFNKKLFFIVVVHVERKRLREEFRRQYQGVTDSQLSLLFGSNEDIIVMKINTHGGQDAFVYFVQKNPAFFELEKIIYPTGSLTSAGYV